MSRYTLAVSLAAMLAMLGCSRRAGETPQTVKAGGNVTLNGQPVEGANVTLTPQGPGRAAFAKTDAQGQFKLATTSSIEGVMPGSYQVGIAKTRTVGALTPEESQAYYEKTGQPPPAPQVIEELPEKYKNPATSALQANVAAQGPNEFFFELKK